MPDSEIEISHLDQARTEDALRARDRVSSAVRAWAAAPKRVVGAVTLPADLGAARAFDALHDARRELAYHVGGEAAARWVRGALSAASPEGGPVPGGGG